MKILSFAFIAVLILVLAGTGLLYFGAINVAATDKHSFLVRWLLSTTMHRSVKQNAKQISVPNLEDKNMQLTGINDFQEMCTICHTAPGATPSSIAQGLNPPAPDLAEAAEHLSAAELFWITKHGIKMTGMPAWGITHSDEELWPVMSFLQTLPGMDATQFQHLSAQAKGLGHHAAHSSSAPNNQPDSKDHYSSNTAPQIFEKSIKDNNHEPTGNHTH